MIKLSHKLILILLVLLLSGCDEKRTYSFYMRHPLELKKGIMQCQSQLEKTKEQIANCEIVMYAFKNMAELITQQQENPEKFGQRILDAQEKYGTLKEEEMQAMKKVNELKQKNASSTELRVAQDDLYKANKASAEKLQEIKELLAVVGLGSPG